jgi:hypothetical protein
VPADEQDGAGLPSAIAGLPPHCVTRPSAGGRSIGAAAAPLGPTETSAPPS